MADDAPARPLAVRFEYHFDRLLAAKLAHAYAVLVPDQRWPVTPPAAVTEEPVDAPTGRHLRARVIRSSA